MIDWVWGKFGSGGEFLAVFPLSENLYSVVLCRSTICYIIPTYISVPGRHRTQVTGMAFHADLHDGRTWSDVQQVSC